MSLLTFQAVMALAVTCQGNLPPQHRVAPEMIAAFAKKESDFNPAAIRANTNKEGIVTSYDYGLMQVNSRNFSWLGLTPATALDPCRSIEAGAKVLTSWSRYNTGSPTAGFANGYVMSIKENLDTLQGAPPTSSVSIEPVPCPEPDENENGWHAVAVPTHCLPADDGWHVTINRR